MGRKLRTEEEQYCADWQSEVGVTSVNPPRVNPPRVYSPRSDQQIEKLKIHSAAAICWACAAACFFPKTVSRVESEKRIEPPKFELHRFLHQYLCSTKKSLDEDEEGIPATAIREISLLQSLEHKYISNFTTKTVKMLHYK